MCPAKTLIRLRECVNFCLAHMSEDTFSDVMAYLLTDVPSKSLSAHPSHTVTNSSVRKSAPTVDYRKSSYPLPENVIASTKSNAKFQNWLQAKGGKDTDDRHRNAQHGNKSYNSNNYSSYQEGDNHGNVGCHSEVDILRVSSSRSPQYATPDIGWNSDDETGEITAAQLMSPEDFDAVADDIIARVKGDISAKDGGAEKFTSEGSNGKLSSHVCPNCEHLMVSFSENILFHVLHSEVWIRQLCQNDFASFLKVGLL